MRWKQIIIMTGCMAILAGCEKQEVISLQTEQTTEEQITQEDTQADSADEVYVYVCGHVKQPGVYALEYGARIYDALAKAGGVLEDAREEVLDQAVCVSDGQTIYVPGADDAEAEKEQDSSESDGLVNINQAGEEELMTLPGIGESKASVIIQYREEHGMFQTIEELMDIPGIKQGVFDKIKDNIKV